ncbi:MAG TPA: tetratricopeptide repeat protein [Gallionella sp.]|nr:tetratricopeptide repeat protein [Gallionella sp.]
MEYHQTGRLSQAEAVYRQILQAAPDHPDALYLCGLAVHESGRSEAAVELISRAIRINPAGPFHYTLGNVLRKLGRLDEAAMHFRAALKLAPSMVEAHLNLGNTLKAQNQLDEAIECFRNALKLKHGLIEAHLNLGNVFRAQGKLDEAAECFHNTIRFKPDYAEAYNNLGGVLREQGDLDGAISQFHRALELKPDMAGIHNNLGCALQAQGKLDEAIDSFEKALILKPDYAEAGSNLGNVFKEQNKLDAAITCYRQVLKFKPDTARVHSDLGIVLLEQNDLNAAKESFHQALELEPKCIDALTGLSGVCQSTGQFAIAKTYLDRALALEPDHPITWAVLPSLRKMTPDDLPWAEKAQRLLGADLKPQEELKLCYALGKYNDDIRQHEAAFGYYDRANRLKRQTAASFDRDDFQRRVDMIIFNHAPEILRQQVVASTSCRPLFIVGMPRSGTSLTEQILASHPDIFGAGELLFWGQQASANLPTMPSWHRDLPLLQNLASQYEAELQRHSTSALRVVDKMPGNFLHLGLMHAAFPQARILHTQRNPIDTCLSIYFQAFNNQHTYATDLDDLAFYYREYHRLMAHWRAVLPPEVFLDVPYEAMVEDQEGWSRRIIEFTGLEWDERCLNFHETERTVGTASNWQVRQKIYKTSKERWRNYEKFVGPLLPLLELVE